MIEFHDVAVCYTPDHRYPINVLEGVDLTIEDGEWVFLVGPSGAGKSTLLKLIYHGAEVSQGKILVDGRDITHLRSHDIALLRRKIGVIFQDFQLLTQKTVWENIAFALQVIGAPQQQLVRDVPRALETVGLTHKAHARPHELSGGEQQRVAIARAIVNHPRILLADEPTGNLDPRTAADIALVLQRISDTGTTIVMATHDRHLVDALKKRVVRIAEGHIVSDEKAGIYHPEDDEPPPTSHLDVHGTELEALETEALEPETEEEKSLAEELAAAERLTANGRRQSGSTQLIAPINKVDLFAVSPISEPNTPAGDTSEELVVRTPLNGIYTSPREQPIEQEASPELPAAPDTPSRVSAYEPVVSYGRAVPDIAPDIDEPHEAVNLETSTYEPTNGASPKKVERPAGLPESDRRRYPSPDYIDQTMGNRAPLGSPENPIIQLDRPPTGHAS
jgi:cell division transport system ATP-binding protein